MKESLHDEMETQPLHIHRFKKESRDTFTIELGYSDEDREFSFLPGQFNMLYMLGVGEVPISISGDASDKKKIVHTIRSYGSVTNAMMKLRAGNVLGVRGPYGKAWPLEIAYGHDVMLIAGGIGIAPLRPVVYYIMAHREEFGKIYLLYGERTPNDLLYKKQIEQWRGRFDLNIDVTVDSAREDWRGNVGVVTKLISDATIDPINTIAMLCGPEIMMYYAIHELRNKNIDEEQIYLSMERNMKCGLGFCGHCQLGPVFVCKDGPVFQYSEIKSLFRQREL